MFNLPAENFVPLPDGLPPERAVLAANMETALNAMWDAAPGPAGRIAVVGAGVLGLLVARLCARMPGTSVTVVDIEPSRAGSPRSWTSLSRRPMPHRGLRSGRAHQRVGGRAADRARLAGNEATVLELSWYGANDVRVPLGGAFHSRRLKLDLEPGRAGRAVAPRALVRTATGSRPRSTCSRPIPRSMR